MYSGQIKAFSPPFIPPTLHTSACSSAYCCVFINVRNTLSYTSIPPVHLQNRSVKTIAFHSQTSSISPSDSFHFTLKFCSLRPQPLSISFPNFHSFTLTPLPFRPRRPSLFIFLQPSNFPTLQPSSCVSVFSPNLSHIYRKSILPFLSHHTAAPISCNLTNLSPIKACHPHLNHSSTLQKHLSATPKPYFLLRHISNKYKRKMY